MSRSRNFSILKNRGAHEVVFALTQIVEQLLHLYVTIFIQENIACVDEHFLVRSALHLSIMGQVM